MVEYINTQRAKHHYSAKPFDGSALVWRQSLDDLCVSRTKGDTLLYYIIGLQRVTG